jgi:hypothetical protein
MKTLHSTFLLLQLATLRGRAATALCHARRNKRRRDLDGWATELANYNHWRARMWQTIASWEFATHLAATLTEPEA